METVNIHEAKTHLSRLIEKAAKGEAFIIAKAGKPMVKVVPLEEKEAPKKRRIGFMDGQFTVPEDFDTMMADEIEEMFYGNLNDFKDIKEK
ncbi:MULTISPECIES: type II toxin-antitoxin system Phd/YefM family antitoxin [unclassified Rhizobium]|uniref:type II toxin-antitoxin system Phd/YefM family antitoxin n=1 Tax=Rhizobium TaxID=379 RepID=UPI00084C1037|nr:MULTISPECIES: type II toxin-antitoxin system Phd/YefM family antitoxin [unclassified Rhizobium]OEC99820.1 prevent-host-death protein [Rhizobium sp. YK2]QYA13832.1 type II toxin-antitoxin system Phd/YefM family antitoxin [Rhizobium sp. AB2/73]UEQ80237.1 type II toxin-antitoxin system Phd/YefM family antitoxin [Rhizobium sp. AB2/73]